MPAHLSLMYPCGNGTWGDPGDGGFIGLAHAPFRLVNSNPKELKSDNMTLKSVTLEQMHDRVGLNRGFDTFQRSIDRTGVMDGMDSYTRQAMDILGSSKLRDALDLSKEDPKVVDRYGVNDPAFQRDGAPRMVRNFCIARRLVEAGARVVSMNFSRWDWHGPDGKNFVQAKEDFPLLDRALCALAGDLHERGLDKDVSVVVWGEFGRHPAHQQGCQPRPLAAGQLRRDVRRRHEDRPGDRGHQPPGRVRRQAPGDAPGGLRHPLPQPGPEPEFHQRAGPEQPAALPGRGRGRADPRVDLS